MSTPMSEQRFVQEYVLNAMTLVENSGESMSAIVRKGLSLYKQIQETIRESS